MSREESNEIPAKTDFWVIFQSFQRRYLEQQQLSKKQSSAVTQEVTQELRRLSSELRKVESEINSKNEQIEKLNRDMRKVNLQSFVRETNSSKNGSKVGDFSPNFQLLTTLKLGHRTTARWSKSARSQE